jgi:CubicO group peptidase (beta-lactamase class C family)
MKIIKKSLRYLVYLLILVIVGLNLFVILSGRFYLYKGFVNTYMKGKMGPGIYDKDIFFSSEIKKSLEPFAWNVSPIKRKLNSKDSKYMETSQTTSFLVFKGDSLLFEEYYGNHNVEMVSNSFSSAKTVVALLIGIALDEGKIKDLDEPVGNYIDSYKSDGKEKITIRHLLMMASGLSWQESGKNPLSENAESYYGEDLRGLLDRQKAVSEPGKMYNYQSGNSQLLGFIIEKATGRSVSDYLYEKIWSQVGAENDAFWSLDKKNGVEKSFCCMYATSRDFARIGKLILNKGKWQEKQLISEEFMNEFVKNPSLKTEEGVPNLRYGLHVWTYYMGETEVHYCRGILGQYIITIPSKNLVIIRTGEKREADVSVPENKINDKAYLEANKYKIGHPADLFKFIAIAERVIK